MYVRGKVSLFPVAKVQQSSEHEIEIKVDAKKW